MNQLTHVRNRKAGTKRGSAVLNKGNTFVAENNGRVYEKGILYQKRGEINFVLCLVFGIKYSWLVLCVDFYVQIQVLMVREEGEEERKERKERKTRTKESSLE